MKTIIGVESFDEVMKRSADRATKLDRGEAVRAERRVTFETAEALVAYLTPQRLRLIPMVREQPLSIAALATSLKRDRSCEPRCAGGAYGGTPQGQDGYQSWPRGRETRSGEGKEPGSTSHDIEDSLFDVW